MIKLSPEELCKAMKCQFQGTSEKGCQAFPDCLALAHAEAVQEALLTKLQNTKLEDLEEIRKQIAAWLEFEEHPQLPLMWDHLQEAHQNGRAAAILTMLSPILAAKIGAAEQAGMEKVAKWMTKPCEHSGAGFYRMKEHRHCTRCLTAFRKEHGLLGGKAVQYPQEGINEQ